MGLPRRLRLGDAARIREVLADGVRASNWLGSLHALPTARTSSRCGLVVSRRVGGAVERNRARRRLAELLREAEPTFAQAFDLVVRSRRSVVEADFARLRAAMGRLLAEAGLVEVAPWQHR